MNFSSTTKGWTVLGHKSAVEETNGKEETIEVANLESVAMRCVYQFEY